MLNIPYFQHKMTVIVTQQLEEILNTKLTINRIDIGLLNRIIIDGVNLKDQHHKPLLNVSRFSASFEILPLFQGKISIRSVQLYGFDISLYQRTEKEPLNCQFLIDALSSKEPKKEPSRLDLRINALLIRQGKVSYDLLSTPHIPDRFNPSHLKLDNLLATISLKHYSSDSLNIALKRMSFREQSGLKLERLKFHFIANQREALLKQFECQLPNSNICLSEIHAEYKNMQDWKQVGDSVFFSFEILPSKITGSDLTPLLPILKGFNSPFYADMTINGRLNYLNIRDLHIYSSPSLRKEIDLQGHVHLQNLFQKNHAYIDASIRSLTLSPEGINQLSQSLAEGGVKTPSFLAHTGTLTLRTDIKGLFSNLKTETSLTSELGKLHAIIHYNTLPDIRNTPRFSFEVDGENVNLGILSGNTKCGKTSFRAQADFTLHGKKFSSLQTKGNITSLEFQNYMYQNIDFDGVYSDKGFDGLISMHDPNGIVNLNGKINLSGKIKEYHLIAEIQRLNPFDLNLSKKYKDNEYSLILHADLAGNKLDDMIGVVDIDSLHIQMPDKAHTISHIGLSAFVEEGIRKVYFDSPFLEANVQGRFDYTTVSTSILKMLKQYIPSLLTVNSPIIPHNNFTFSAHFHNTQALTDLFQLPLTIHENSFFSGSIDDDAHTMHLQGDFPNFNYNNFHIKDAILLCNNSPELFDCNIHGNALMKDSSLLNLSLQAKAKDDRIQTSFEWKNNVGEEYRGKLSASALLRKNNYSKRLLAEIAIQPTDIILRDSLWHISEAAIYVDSNRINISELNLQHKSQAIRINGMISQAADEPLKVDLQNVHLEYIFDIINFHPVDFAGVATGTATAYRLLKQPNLEAFLDVKKFRFNGALLGDMGINGSWDPEQDVVGINAQMKEEKLSTTRVLGEVHPKRKGLDLQITADRTNLAFIQPYVESVISGIDGRTSGGYRLFGGFKTLALEGKGKANASFHINILGVTYQLDDSIKIYPDRFVLNNAKIYDKEGHSGSVNATLSHSYLKDFRYQLQMQSNNMLILNKRETFDLPFYGKIYATGNATLTGNSDRLDVTAGVSTSDQTEFCYKLTSGTTATNSEFVQFKNEKSSKDSLPEDPHNPILENSTTDVRLNLLIDANPQTIMKVIIDPKSGDYISCSGTGNIRLDYFNKGDLRMFGTYTINQGVYKFSLQEVIRKDFTIRSGSTVSFNGDPYRANCDINAVYAVNSVSLRDLGNDVVNALPNRQTNVKVNCLMDITGMVASPELNLGIELPNENEEVQRVVRNFISTDDQMNMQILYLLGIGKFYTPDYANKTDQNSNAMSSVLSSTISGQLNNMLSQVINSNKWNFGVNGSTGVNGWTDMEFQGMLSGQLLNNRLLINGNFGYRDNSVTNNTQQSNFIGDFDIEYLLTKTGDIRMKAYNKSNDRYSTKTNLNTQGVGVLFKKDFNSWWDFLPWKRKKKTTK